MMRIRINNDLHMRAATAGAGDHLLASGGKGPIVGVADENQSRYQRAPGVLQETAATWVKGDGRAEIGRVAVDRDGPPDAPQCSRGAIGPAKQRNVVATDIALFLQPKPCRIGVIDALAPRMHGAVLLAAL